MRNSYFVTQDELSHSKKIEISFSEEVSFLHKAAIKQTLNKIPKGYTLNIDATNAKYIAHDVLVLINDFKNQTSKTKGIEVQMIGFKDSYSLSSIDHVHTS
jgi:MFS superfamily sulfate permease-like transporter